MWEIVDSYGIVVKTTKTLAQAGVWIDPVLGIDFSGKAWGLQRTCKYCDQFIALDGQERWIETEYLEYEDRPWECVATPKGVPFPGPHVPGKRLSIDHNRFTRNDDGSYTVYMTSKGFDVGGSFIVRKERKT